MEESGVKAVKYTELELRAMWKCVCWTLQRKSRTLNANDLILQRRRLNDERQFVVNNQLGPDVTFYWIISEHSGKRWIARCKSNIVKNQKLGVRRVLNI